MKKRRIPPDCPSDSLTPRSETAAERAIVLVVDQLTAAERELEALRGDICCFCLCSSLQHARYSAAYRRHKKNGVLIRWEHVFDGNKGNALACLAGASREREYQAKRAGVWG